PFVRGGRGGVVERLVLEGIANCKLRILNCKLEGGVRGSCARRTLGLSARPPLPPLPKGGSGPRAVFELQVSWPFAAPPPPPPPLGRGGEICNLKSTIFNLHSLPCRPFFAVGTRPKAEYLPRALGTMAYFPPTRTFSEMMLSSRASGPPSGPFG